MKYIPFSCQKVRDKIISVVVVIFSLVIIMTWGPTVNGE